MDRLDAFEKMLAHVLERQRAEKEQLEDLRTQGKEKTVTFKQLMANRLLWGTIVDLYRDFGLID